VLETPPTPVLTADAGLHTISEFINTTGSTQLDTAPSGTLTFTDFNLTTVSASMASITWSGGATLPTGLAAVLAGALSITTDRTSSDSGSIAITFSAADNNFDFLAANETLTVVYNVTVTDNNGVSLTQPVTITTAGTNDAPVLAADVSGRHTITEGLNTTGTLTFTDVDLSDHHAVSTSVASASGRAAPRCRAG
jgi:VCBS repeat-containing protein